MTKKNKHIGRLVGRLESFVERALELKKQLEAYQTRLEEIAQNDVSPETLAADLQKYAPAQQALGKLAGVDDPEKWVDTADVASDAVQELIDEIEASGKHASLAKEHQEILGFLESASGLVEKSGLEQHVEDIEEYNEDVQDLLGDDEPDEDELTSLGRQMKKTFIKITQTYDKLSATAQSQHLRGVLTRLYALLGDLNTLLGKINQDTINLPDPVPEEEDPSAQDESGLLEQLKSIRIHIGSLKSTLGTTASPSEWGGSAATLTTQLNNWLEINQQLSAPDATAAQQYQGTLDDLGRADGDVNAFANLERNLQGYLDDIENNRGPLAGAMGELGAIAAGLSALGDASVVKGLIDAANKAAGEIREKLHGDTAEDPTKDPAPDQTKKAPLTGDALIKSEMDGLQRAIEHEERVIAQQHDPAAWIETAKTLFGLIDQWIEKNSALDKSEEGLRMAIEAKRTPVKKVEGKVGLVNSLIESLAAKELIAADPARLSRADLEREIEELGKLYEANQTLIADLGGEPAGVGLLGRLGETVFAFTELQEKLQSTLDHLGDVSPEEGADKLFQTIQDAIKALQDIGSPKKWKERYNDVYYKVDEWLDTYSEDHADRASVLQKLRDTADESYKLAELTEWQEGELEKLIEQRPKKDEEWDDFRPYVSAMKEALEKLSDDLGADPHTQQLVSYVQSLQGRHNSDLQEFDPNDSSFLFD